MGFETEENRESDFSFSKKFKMKILRNVSLGAREISMILSTGGDTDVISESPLTGWSVP